MTTRAFCVIAISAALVVTGCAREETADSASSERELPRAEKPADDDSDSRNVERAIERATVRVRNLTCDGVATGSGFFIGDDLLVTNHHVVDGALQLEINIWDGGLKTVEAVEVARSGQDDIAVVRIDGEAPSDPLEPADDQVARGDELRVAGFPAGGQYRLLRATASGYTVLNTTVGGVTYRNARRLEFASDAKPGNSGGPVVNSDGDVVGVLDLGLPGRSWALPVDDVMRIANGKLRPTVPCRSTQADDAPAAGAGEPADSILDCPSFGLTGVEGEAKFGYFAISVRNMTCEEAKPMILERGATGSPNERAEARGFSCSALDASALPSGGRGERCARGDQAFRYTLGS